MCSTGEEADCESSVLCGLGRYWKGGDKATLDGQIRDLRQFFFSLVGKDACPKALSGCLSKFPVLCR